MALLGILPWAPSRLGADGGSLELPLGLRLDFVVAGSGLVSSAMLTDLKVRRGGAAEGSRSCQLAAVHQKIGRAHV